MNRGRGRHTGGGGYANPGGGSTRSVGQSDHRQDRDKPTADYPFGRGSLGRGSKYSMHKPAAHAPRYEYRPKRTLPDGKDGFPNIEKLQLEQNYPEPGVSDPEQSKNFVASKSHNDDDLNSLSAGSGLKDIHLDVRTVQIAQVPGDGAEDSTTLHLDLSHKVYTAFLKDESQLHSKDTADTAKSVHPEHPAAVEAFDICPTKTGTSVTLKTPLLTKNRERRNEINRSLEQQNGSVLRSGMVILKNYLSLSDQVKIVKTCRELGLGSGGFYQPGYRDGAKLHLKMMCLGKNWDPETSKYGVCRLIDGAKPPVIPRELNQFVEKAIKDSHALIKRIPKASRVRSVESILPWMSPNLCIVNFYLSSGRLGLHQDRDESPESLQKGLPVVSFSLGDSAEFLYGDRRDVDKADKVVLESGDVLIFGGESRLIFHGVSSIIQNTAPKALLEETNLRPGRLNLTFREY